MSEATDADYADLDIREQIIHIDQMQADIRRKQQEMRLAPLTLMISGMSAGAAIAGSAVALTAIAIKAWGL